MSIIDSAVTWAIGIAKDNSHGYSQNVRWGPSYDCSSLVISAYQQAGVPVKSRGASYTGNMRSVFKSCGFVEVPKPWTTATLKKGDVLLNEASHTVLYIGNGQIVNARTSEGTTDTADNSGNEIRVQSYYDGNWDVVLRYKEVASTTTQNAATSQNTSSQTTSKPATTTTTTTQTSSQSNASNAQASTPVSTPVVTEIVLPTIKSGSTGKTARAMQLLLIGAGYSCGWYGADGNVGAASISSLNEFKKANGLPANGACDMSTWKKLLGL